MEQNQQESTFQEECRHIAAKAFMESLDQLGQRLQSCEDENAGLSSSGSQPPSQPSSLCSQAIDAQALEDAAADIEQFMQTMQTKNTSTSSSDSPTPQG